MIALLVGTSPVGTALNGEGELLIDKVKAENVSST